MSRIRIPPPLNVPAFTSEVAAEVGAVARALPYRSSIGVDAERVYWVVVNGSERIGIAWTDDAPGGPWWMVAISYPDGRAATRGRTREIVELVAGRGARFERAPLVDG